MAPKHEEAGSGSEDALAAEARRLSGLSERLARKSKAIREQIDALVGQTGEAAPRHIDGRKQEPEVED